MSMVSEHDAEVVQLPRPSKPRWRERHPLIKYGVPVAVAAVLLTGVLALIVYFSPWLTVQNIEVEGVERANGQQITQALEPLKGTPLAQISQDHIASELEAIAPFKDVTVNVNPPATLVVKVTERTPMGVVDTGNGFTLVDADGVVLQTEKDRGKITEKVPTIEGLPQGAKGEEFETGVQVLQSLPKDVFGQVNAINMKNPKAVELTLDGDIKVLWGDFNQSQLKGRVLDALMKDQASRSAEQQPKKVFDVSSPRTPVIR